MQCLCSNLATPVSVVWEWRTFSCSYQPACYHLHLQVGCQRAGDPLRPSSKWLCLQDLCGFYLLVCHHRDICSNMWGKPPKQLITRKRQDNVLFPKYMLCVDHINKSQDQQSSSVQPQTTGGGNFQTVHTDRDLSIYFVVVTESAEQLSWPIDNCRVQEAIFKQSKHTNWGMDT